MASKDALSMGELEQVLRRLAFSGPRVGWAVGTDGRGGLLVDFENSSGPPVLARSTVPLDEQLLASAVDQRQGVVLLFEDCDPSRPLLMGFIQSYPSTPLLEELLGKAARAPAMEARVDGKQVVLEGQDEVILKCGEASITLRRNGKIVIRGAQVETRAAGTNRIRGGAVKIN
ncbi:DUF6484 domain-containing protein [Pyxidicoccus sp. 3LG]